MYDSSEGKDLPEECEEWKEQLALLHMDILPVHEREELDAHIQSCSNCSSVAVEYRLIDEYLRRSFAVEPLPELPPQLVELWKEEEKQKAVVKERSSLIRSLLHVFAHMRFGQVMAGKRRAVPVSLALTTMLFILMMLTPIPLRAPAIAGSLSLQPTSPPEPPLASSAWVHMVAWSPDGEEIASQWGDNIMQVWDAHTRKEIFHTEVSWGTGLAWSPDGKYLATIGTDDTIQILDVALCKNYSDNCPAILTYKGHNAAVKAIAWSPDGTKIVSASEDKTVQVWEVHTTSPRFTQTLYTYTDKTLNGQFTAVAWSPDGQRIVSGDENSHVQVWDALTGEHLLSYAGHIAGNIPDSITSLSWSPDGKYIASAGYKGTANVWDAKTGHTISRISIQTNDPSGNNRNEPIYAVSWSPKGLLLALASHGTVQVYNGITGDHIASCGLPFGHSGDKSSDLFTVAWSPDGQQIVSGGSGGFIFTLQRK